MISESSEFPTGSKIEDLTGDYVELAGRDSIRVAARLLGANRWEEMIQATQHDLKERGLVVARKRNGNLDENEIFISEETEAQKSIEIPFSQVLKSLVPGRSNLTFVHTHAMPPTVDHLRTTVFSDLDLQGLLETDYRALVMLDRGGAHLLVPVSKFARSRRSFDSGLVAKAVEKIKQKNGGTLDVVKDVAGTLAGQGFGYFYTPELCQTKGETVTFYNPKMIPAV